MVRFVSPMPNLPRIWLASLAVVFVLTAGFGASALASTGLDPDGSVLAQAPKGSHKPNPNATPTPTPVPTKKPAATPKPTPRPTTRPPAPTATPRPKPKPTPTPAPPAVLTTPGPSPTQRAAVTGTDRRDPGTHVSVLAIGQEPLAIAVSIVAIAGVALLAAWFVLARRRAIALWASATFLPAMRARFTLRRPRRAAPQAASAAVPTAPAEPTRKKRGQKSGGAKGDRRSGHLDDVFAGSAARRVVQQDHVQLLNVPSGSFGTPLTELGSGREVKILERHDSWAKVRTPWGEEGWLPESVLGT